MKRGDVLAVGDVVQIDPTVEDSFFAGAFMLVTEVKGWGAKGFVCIPQDRVKGPGRAYFRCKYEHMSRVGRAHWVPADDIAQASIASAKGQEPS